MTWLHAVLIALAGLWAGAINAVVGSGTLVTFPLLVALGYPPVTATTSNAVGLIPGTIAGAVGYRKEIRGHWARVGRYCVASLVGAVGGTALLLSLPPDAFEAIVPVLVALALVLVVVSPKLSAWLAARRGADGEPHRPGLRSQILLYALIFLAGVYGGYFTAAQGVLLMGVMGILLADPLQRLNGFKNVLSSVVNLVAGAVYAFVAPVDWPVIAVIAVSSTVGGVLGAMVGRKLPPLVLRVVIVLVGLAAIVQFVLR